VSRVVVITGASAGVGRATARKFGERGDKVALIARGRAGLEAAAAEVREAGGTALILPLDVADADAVEAAAERVERELGPIDVWVNDAMSAVLAFAWDVATEDYRRVTEVSYLGYVHGTLAALRRMRPRDRGVILQVGSALAYRAIPLQASYCASKFAIRGFTDALRTELEHEQSNVRVTMVQLPGVNTPQFTWVRTTLHRRPKPVPPFFQPEIPAEAIVWAADHPRREVWVGLNSAVIIAGNKVAPRLADWYLAKTSVQAQQDETPIDPHRRDDLYAPLDDAEDRGAHGPYDARAKRHGVQLAFVKHRRAAGVAAAAGLVAGAALAGRSRA
jgi:NADP-dependent 3-hydroxy acid dehydrogenase YdfG